jgi:hypothetical protein
LESELWCTHAWYINLQHRVEPHVRMTRIRQSVLYYPNGDDAMVYEKTEHPYRYPKAHGVKDPQTLRQARALARLQVRRFAPTPWTPEDLLGNERVSLTHLEV